MFKKVARYCIQKREHIFNVSSHIIARFLSLGLFALTIPYFVNRTGAAKYGILVLVLVIYNYLNLFDFGLGYSIGYRFTRAHARANKNVWRILQKALPVYLVSGVLVTVILFFFSGYLSVWLCKSIEYKSLFQLAALACFLLIFSSLLTSILQAYNKIYFVNLSRFLLDIIKALSLVVGVLTGGDLKIVMIFIIFGTFVKLIIDIFLTRKVIGHIKWLQPVISMREVVFNFAFGLPMFIVLANAMLVNGIDKMYVAKMFSVTELSYYSVASDLHTKAFFFIHAINSSLMTLLTRKSVLKADIRGLMFIMIASVAVILVFYYLPLFLFAKSILRIWINADFAEKAAGIVRAMSLVSITYMVMNVFYILLQSCGRMKDIMVAYTISTLVFLATLYYLPKLYGIYGVIFSYALMQFTQAFICACFVKYRKILYSHKSMDAGS